MRALVIPNDPLRSYVIKGEVKPRYFNPDNLYDEVYFLTFTLEEEPYEEIKATVGKAYYEIIQLPPINLLNYRKMAEIAKEIAKRIKPDLIRVYNPLLQGYVAYRLADDRPLVLSIHTEYDHDHRFLRLKKRNFIGFVKLLYTRLAVEPKVVRRADLVICAYKFLEGYAKRMGAKRTEIIYNKIDYNRFSKVANQRNYNDISTILSVGALTYEKGHDILVKAIAETEFKLVIVGRGPEKERLLNLALKLGLVDRVRIIEYVRYEEMHKPYAEAEVFGTAIRLGGISIPVLEAMATGLPLVVSGDRLNGDRLVVKDAAVIVRNKPEQFRDAFLYLKDNPDYAKKLGENAVKRARYFDYRVQEVREARAIQSVVEEFRGRRD